MIQRFKSLVEKYDRVTIVTHCYSDADTIATGLGIYLLLKRVGKEVEICNVDKKLPNYLDFLPHFAKIKTQIDFNNSLIIACDAGSIDLLGFDLSSKEIVNIDHHKSNTNYGTLNIVDSTCASASMVAYGLFKDDFEITKDIATCFYVALVTDTQNFVTLNVDQKVFQVASELISFGINLEMVNKNLNQRRSLSSLRLLSATLETLELSNDAQIASMVICRDMMLKTGAYAVDTVGIIDHAISLATVKIAILVIEFEHYLKVSLRSDGVDVSSLAIAFGGGGHLVASGFRSEELDINLVLKQIKNEIKQRGLIDGS